MPDTTFNYGFRIPSLDGHDYQVPDDVRVPVTSIDARIKILSDALVTANAAITAANNKIALIPDTAAGNKIFSFGGGNTLSIVIYFPTGRFTVAPSVVVSLYTGYEIADVVISAAPNATGFTAKVYSTNNAAMSGDFIVHWQAQEIK